MVITETKYLLVLVFVEVTSVIKLLCGETVSSTVKDNLISFRSDYTNFSVVGSSFCCCTRYQFVFFKPLSYSFEEAIGFDIKASFARVVYYQIRWYKKKCLQKAIQFHGTFHGIKITNWYGWFYYYSGFRSFIESPTFNAFTIESVPFFKFTLH